jgi:hypothetical protein
MSTRGLKKSGARFKMNDGKGDLSGNNNSDNDSRPAGRQGRRAELGEEESWLRQEVELGFGFDLDSPA